MPEANPASVGHEEEVEGRIIEEIGGVSAAESADSGDLVCLAFACVVFSLHFSSKGRIGQLLRPTVLLLALPLECP